MTRKRVGRLLWIFGLPIFAVAASGEPFAGDALAESPPVTPMAVVHPIDTLTAQQRKLSLGLTVDRRAKLDAAARDLAARVDRPPTRTVRAKTPLEHARDVAASPNYAILGSLADGDIEALAFIVLMEAAKATQDDLASIMAAVKAINNKKQKQRQLIDQARAHADALGPDAGKDDSLKELSADQMARMEMYLSREAKLEEAISNVLHKMSDTQNGIIGNMK